MLQLHEFIFSLIISKLLYTLLLFFLNVCTTYHTFIGFSIFKFAFCMHARIIRKNVFSFSVCFCCYAYKLLSYIYLKFNFLTNYCIQGYFRPVLFSPFYTWNSFTPSWIRSDTVRKYILFLNITVTVEPRYLKHRYLKYYGYF